MSLAQAVKLAFTSKAITQKVGDVERQFYPISIRVAFNLQNVAKPLARALTTLLSPTKQDTGAVYETYVQKDGTAIERQTASAPSPELADLRMKQRQEAVELLVGTLLDKQNESIIGELFIDALTPPRERKRGEVDSADIEEFMANVDLGAMFDLFQGVAKANAAVFGPLGEKLARQAIEVVERAVKPGSNPDSSSTSSPIPETNGSDSKTP